MAYLRLTMYMSGTPGTYSRVSRAHRTTTANGRTDLADAATELAVARRDDVAPVRGDALHEAVVRIGARV